MKKIAVFSLMLMIFAGLNSVQAGKYDFDAVPRETFNSWLAFFSYDSEAPLSGRTAYSIDLNDSVVRENVSYRSGYHGRVPAYLALPKDSSRAPFPVVLATHGAGDGVTQAKNKSYIRQWMELLCANGYAVLAIDARGHGERSHEIGFRSVQQAFNVPSARRDMFTGTVVDWRRGIDYLESRPDIDATRLGLLGSSMGTMYGAVLAAVEERIDAAVFVVGGMPPDSWTVLPEVHQANYVGRIAPRPVLMLNGKQDVTLIPEGSRKWFALSGEPKEQVWYEAGHGLSGQLELYSDKLLDFLDRHLRK